MTSASSHVMADCTINVVDLRCMRTHIVNTETSTLKKLSLPIFSVLKSTIWWNSRTNDTVKLAFKSTYTVGNYALLIRQQALSCLLTVKRSSGGKHEI